MKKFVAVIVSLITLGLFVILAWWLYRNFHSTPMLIVNLLIVLTGLLISITIYFRLGEDYRNKKLIDEEDYPPIETGLIYADVQDFVNKHESEEGKLFIVGIDIKDKSYRLKKVTFNKLIDELVFDLGSELQIILTGVSTIAVGDKQMIRYGFETGVIKYDKQYDFDWRGNRLMLNSEKNEPVQLKIPAQMPTIIFDWT